MLARLQWALLAVAIGAACSADADKGCASTESCPSSSKDNVPAACAEDAVVDDMHVSLLQEKHSVARAKQAEVKKHSNDQVDMESAGEIPAYSGTATYTLDQACNGMDGTCSMAECLTPSTDSACTFTAEDFDAQSNLDKEPCQTCTQATDPRCTTEFLTSVVKSNGGIFAAYCNDKNLVIMSSGAPSHTPDLENVVIPPSGTVDGVACVTRNWSEKYKRYLIPVVSVYTPAFVTSPNRSTNANTASFPGGAGCTATDCWLSHADNGDYGLPSAGSTGVSIGGEDVFPVFSDQVVLTPESCEVDSCNEHVGQGGGGPHLHGDPFHQTAGKCLYSPEDYVLDGVQNVEAHPPLVGFALDGPSIYGRYLSTNAPGYSVTMDDCGGHVHTDYVYHYHAQVKSATATSRNKAKVDEGTEFPAFPFGPDQCYKVDISQIASYWAGNEASEYSKPCCGMTEYYVKDVTIDGAGATAGATTTTAASSGTCDYGTCSGTDDKGKGCPPDYGNGKPDCPSGCTATPATGCSA